MAVGAFPPLTQPDSCPKSFFPQILDHHIAMLQQHGQYLEQLAREAEPRIFDQLTEHKTLVNMRVRARHMLDDAQDARRIMVCTLLLSVPTSPFPMVALGEELPVASR